jgi:hypothetical protein
LDGPLGLEILTPLILAQSMPSGAIHPSRMREAR